MNASGDASVHVPEPRRHVVGLTGGETADDHALGLERGIEFVVDNAAVAHHHEAGAIARFGGEEPAPGRRLDARVAELVGRERPVAVGIERIDAPSSARSPRPTRAR